MKNFWHDCFDSGVVAVFFSLCLSMWTRIIILRFLLTVYQDDLGSSTVFLQSCPQIQSLDDSFRGVLLSPPASQPPGPDRDASCRNLFVTESYPQRVTSSPIVTMHFERWCNPAPSVILCHISWTPWCVFCRTLYARCEHAQFNTLMSTPTQTVTSWLLVSWNASTTCETWKCVTSCVWMEKHILTLCYTLRVKSSFRVILTSGALCAL